MNESQPFQSRVSESRSGTAKSSEALLEVRDLKVYYPARNARNEATVVKAVDGVSLSIGAGETLGLVGESGSGKSTIGRAILGLTPWAGGELFLEGSRLDPGSRRSMKRLRSVVQVVFQDPFQSLNPRMTIEQILMEPLQIQGKIKGGGLKDLEGVLDKVKLPRAALHRYPREFSGGQRQRIGIARALLVDPRLIICDEAVSALDVSIQAQVVNLLMDLQKELGLALLFITHELSVVRRISHRVVALYCGKIVEHAEASAICSNPQHPYTQGLIAAAPEVGLTKEERHSRKLLRISGESPSPMDPPTGCTFHPRCPLADSLCSSEKPTMRNLALEEEHEHGVSCHHV